MTRDMRMFFDTLNIMEAIDLVDRGEREMPEQTLRAVVLNP